MKKFLVLSVLTALLLPLSGKADVVNLGISYTARPFGNANQSGAALYGYDATNNVLRQVAVDGSGNLQTSGGGGASSSVSVTSISSGQGLSITSSPVFNSLSTSTYVWQTYTATTLNLTTVAGVSVRCTICLSPSFGGAGIRTVWSTSSTAPSDIYGVGSPIATSATAQCFGPFAPGTIFHVIGTGSASVTGRLQVDGVY